MAESHVGKTANQEDQQVCHRVTRASSSLQPGVPIEPSRHLPSHSSLQSANLKVSAILTSKSEREKIRNVHNH